MQVKRFREEEDEASNPLHPAKFGSSSRGNQTAQQAYSNIEVREGSRAHLGNVVNTINLSFVDEDEKRAQQIINSLYFNDIDRRRDGVGFASSSTFEWLLDAEIASIAEPVAEARSIADDGTVLNEPEKRDSHYRKEREQERHQYRIDACNCMTSWIQSKGGIFWISGAAASGKSTLMKFLRSSKRTHELLMEWAAGSQLIVADHYFWHTGSTLQKSQEGLYRTILYKIFVANAKLTKIACHNRWNTTSRSGSWSENEFFEAIASLHKSGIKLCLFIDGLDEYSPQIDHYLLLDTILRLSKLSNVKVCVSSRPWKIFKDNFPDPDRKLTLDKLNRIDIENFVIEKMQQHTARTPLYADFKQPISNQAAHFVDDFVRRSQGVFLWAFLVIQRLTARVKFVQQLSDLERYMLQLPSELEQYFKDLIFERINPAWKSSAETAAALMFMLNEYNDLRYFWSLLTGRVLEDENFGMSQPVQFFPDAWFDLQLRRTLDFLKDCCPDLLSLMDSRLDSEDYKAPYYGEWAHWTIEFSHRTISDFLQTEELQQHLKQHCPRHLQPHDNPQGMAKLELFICKVLPTQYKLESPSEDEEDEFFPLEETLHLVRAAFSFGQVDMLLESEIILLSIARQYPDLLPWRPDKRLLYNTFRYLSAYHLHSFSRFLGQNGLHSKLSANAVLEGALATGVFVYVDGKDEEWPLSSVSLSNVEAALEYEPDLKDPSDGPHYNPDTGRNIWHEFLFKWWRWTPGTIWAASDISTGTPKQLPRVESSTLGFEEVVGDYGRYGRHRYLVPNKTFADLPYNHGSGDNITPWQIAKSLIENGARIRDSICLTEDRCPVRRHGSPYPERLTTDGVEIVSEGFHPIAACWRADVIDVLKALVPFSCTKELEDIREAHEAGNISLADGKGPS